MAALVAAIHAAPPDDLDRKRIVFRIRCLSWGSDVLVSGRVDPRIKSGDGHDAS